ncbi:MAG: hypothetical protein H0T79_22380, partial [Deltaproteobacteria bacterium]|nr:hypothetical protein [Deltaproteobacteria bacterium]
MTRLGMVVALALAAVACGHGEGERSSKDDAPNGGGQTFAAFLLDLIENQTANDTDPVAFAEFATLPDPDRD